MKEGIFRRTVGVFFSAVLVLSLPGAALAASNNILSGNIKEADGSTGQDTDNGSGVKTGHIQNGAITNEKLAPDVVAIINALETRISQLETRVAAIEGNSALALGPYVQVSSAELNGVPGPHVIIEGANLHVRSGLGVTDQNNGLGNIIIGYNEGFTGGWQPANLLPTDRQGSHNLVLGVFNAFASSGGIVMGWNNIVRDVGSAIIGGDENLVEASYSAIVSGNQNKILSNMYESAIFGGFNNQISPIPYNGFGRETVIVGGRNNASMEGTVVGGSGNTATNRGTVLGGEGNSAQGSLSTVTGGLNRVAPGDHDWVGGSLFQDF